jgi:hypothetical protein
VLLRWEAAYGRNYVIQVSDNNTVWTNAASQSSGDGGNDTLAVGRTGRYVRMYGTARGTEWGYSLYEFEVYGSVVTGVGEAGDGLLPRSCALFDNYPNPFNPSTIIKYTVAGARDQGPALSGVEGSGVSDVKLTVYDLLGRKVAVLVNERKTPGTYEVRFDGTGLASGVYIYRMTAGPFTQTKRMVLVR